MKPGSNSAASLTNRSSPELCRVSRFASAPEEPPAHSDLRLITCHIDPLINRLPKRVFAYGAHPAAGGHNITLR